jgi:hypothetical protein
MLWILKSLIILVMKGISLLPTPTTMLAPKPRTLLGRMSVQMDQHIGDVHLQIASMATAPEPYCVAFVIPRRTNTLESLDPIRNSYTTAWSLYRRITQYTVRARVFPVVLIVPDVDRKWIHLYGRPRIT